MKLDLSKTASSGGGAATGGSYSLVNIETSGYTSAGTLAADTSASKGSALITSSSGANLYTATFDDVVYGRYALCMRLKSSNNTSSSTVISAVVSNGSTTILTKNAVGTEFSSTSEYCDIYATFTYTGSTSAAKQPLKIAISNKISGEVRFDYAYITLLTPAIYS